MPLSLSFSQVPVDVLSFLPQILVHLQSTPSYQRSVQTLLSLLRSFLSRALIQAKPTATLHPVPLAPPEGEDSPLTPPETPPHPSIDEAVEEEGEDDEGAGDPTELLIPLLEPFTGGAGSLAPLRDALHSLLAHLQTPSPDLADDVDEELHRSTIPSHLHTLATLLDTLLSKSLLIPGWIGSSESYRSLSNIHDVLLSLSSDAPALRTDLAHFLSLLLDALGSVANDPLLGRAVTAMEELGKALGGWAGAAGETAVRAAGGEGVMAVWGDVVEWVVPRVLGVLKEVPLPRCVFPFLPYIFGTDFPLSTLLLARSQDRVRLQERRPRDRPSLPSLDLFHPVLPLPPHLHLPHLPPHLGLFLPRPPTLRLACRLADPVPRLGRSKDGLCGVDGGGR